MRRRDQIQQDLKFDAVINKGFTPGASLGQGLVMGAEDLDLGSQGSVGLVVPWMGSKHIKILVGDPE